MKSSLALIALALLLAPPLVSQTTYIVDPYGGGDFTTITDAANASYSGDTILIKPHMDMSTSPPTAPTGYSETHLGGNESFPIKIRSGVQVKRYGTANNVYIWSSTASPPEAIFELFSSLTPNPIQTRIEDLFIFGGIRGLTITPTDKDGNSAVEFKGVIAKCQFAGNQIAVDLENDQDLTAEIAIRNCTIRSDIPTSPQNQTNPPVLQSQTVGIRLLALEPSSSTNPPKISAQIKNLDTAGPFDSMDPDQIPILNGWHDIDLPPNATDFTRLIQVCAKGRGVHLEHSNPPNLSPIPEVNVQFIGGNLLGMATANSPTSGWDVGIYACTSFSGSQDYKDFVAGYRLETSGTVVDGFKLAGIHGTCKKWGRGEISLNGNTVVRETGRHSAPWLSNRALNGVHMTAFYSYLRLEAVDSNIHSNRGSGIFMRTQSSTILSEMACPTGNMIDAEDCNIYGNSKHGLSFIVDEDGIVGGALHHPGVISLLKGGGTTNYSVEFGQGSVDSCAISNNFKAGIYFNLNNNGGDLFPSYASVRFTNSIIWNNTGGGYLADLSGNHAENPFLLAPIGHCTFAGNGNAVNPFSMKIIEQDRPQFLHGVYRWSGPNPDGGTLSTKVFNSIFERKNPNENDFPDYMLFGSERFVLDNPLVTDDFQIGAGGLRYQDGRMSPLFEVSTYDPTPFIDSSSWATLDPSKFYLLNLGGNNVFGKTPKTFPIDGNETAYDHEDDLRPVASGGTRDKGADEK